MAEDAHSQGSMPAHPYSTGEPEFFRLAIETMRDGVVVHNARGEVVVCNARAGEILGVSPEQMVGLTSMDSRWRVTHEDGTEWPGESHPAMLALYGGRSSRDVLMGLQKSGAIPIWLRVNADPVVRSGCDKVDAVVVTFADVTERVRLEAEQDQLVREAIERADRDPLTDLLNHRTFHHYLRVEPARALGEGSALAVLVLDMDNFKFFNGAYGHLVGDEVLCSVADRLRAACLPRDLLARIGGDEFAILLGPASRMELLERTEAIRKAVQRLAYRPRAEQSQIPLRLSLGVAFLPDDATTGAEALYIADKRSMQDKDGGQDRTSSESRRKALRCNTDGFGMLDALVEAVNNKDRYTRTHSEDVMELCALMARDMGLPAHEIESIETAALVHDVGKIGVPFRILRHPARLPKEDDEIMKKHAALGATLVAAVPELAHTLGAVRHHHERWDGKGYPDGLAGTDIPLAARIMAVADTFSAMTLDRPYRQGVRPVDALQELNRVAGSQLDTQCVSAFNRIFASVKELKRKAASGADIQPAPESDEAAD